jgi:hypothetical protein
MSPLLDVSFAVCSPMLADSFTVLRRTQTVNNFGIGSVASQTITPVYGVVAPSTENDLERFPDLEVQSKAITVITSFALRGEAEVAGVRYNAGGYNQGGYGGSEAISFQPDIVVWNNDNFLVRALEDWSQYAAGFILAICTSTDLVDQPPSTEPFPFSAE